MEHGRSRASLPDRHERSRLHVRRADCSNSLTADALNGVSMSMATAEEAVGEGTSGAAVIVAGKTANSAMRARLGIGSTGEAYSPCVSRPSQTGGHQYYYRHQT